MILFDAPNPYQCYVGLNPEEISNNQEGKNISTKLPTVCQKLASYRQDHYQEYDPNGFFRVTSVIIIRNHHTGVGFGNLRLFFWNMDMLSALETQSWPNLLQSHSTFGENMNDFEPL